MGVVVSYAAALIFNALGMTNADGSAILDFTNIASAAWVGVPEFLSVNSISPLFWLWPDRPCFHDGHIGDMSAISATVGENFIEDPGLHRTLIGDGLATSSPH